MAKLRGDHLTMELLAWEPAPIVEAFASERVRTSSLRSKIARAVSECMTDAEPSRATLGSGPINILPI